jgi:lysophospholipase L1-like esterase
MENKLYKKTIIWNGDSICAGSSATGNWATRIAAKNDMQYKNYAVGGGTVTENLMPCKNGKQRHSVSATLDKMYEEFCDADYVILEGGTNDADLAGSLVRGEKTRIGAFDPLDYSGQYDVLTFCGALESVFYRATKYWMGKNIGFIVAQKMNDQSNDSFVNRRLYFDKAVEICRKWGIPCLDLWNGCYLNPNLPFMYDRTKTPDENRQQNTGFYIDGQHLTSYGYDVTADIIESWLKSL